jgi:hypothetical protein
MPTQDQFLPAFKLASWNGATHFGEKLIISLFFLLGMFFYQNSLANELQSPIVFEISHTFKLRQLSFLKIYQDGKVHYHKYETDDEELSKADNLPKDHYAQLSKSQVDELINEFLSLPYKELAKYEPKKGNEIEGFSINFKIGHVKMSISDRIFHMALFTKLRKYLAKELKAWFCSPEGYKYFDKNCPDYLYLPENFKF